MMRAAARAAARLLTLIWLIGIVAVVGLAAWSHLAPLVVVAGGSMAPAIPLGSVVAPQPVDPHDIRIGDVVTVRADNGVLVTHRVNRVADLPNGLHVELRGDANPGPDPVLVPASAVVGRIGFFVPVAGYVLSMLTSLAGVVAVLALFAAMLMTIWLLEDVADGDTVAPERPPAIAAERARAAR